MATNCCADCGKEEEGGISLKTCKPCMQVKYCNAACQKKHWTTHKKSCKQRATELRDEALFKDPPAKEDCPICFLPMPLKLICCITAFPLVRHSKKKFKVSTSRDGKKRRQKKTYIGATLPRVGRPVGV